MCDSIVFEYFVLAVLGEKRMFPIDDYTPHGYLDNPAHAWKLGGVKGGVLRSRPALGIGWHFPSFAHAYNRKKEYVTHFQFGFNIGGKVFLDTVDFEKAKTNLYCDYHSKNLLRFVFQTVNGVVVQMTFFVADAGDTADIVACRLRLINTGSKTQKVSYVAALDYERTPGEGRDWFSGLASRFDRFGPTGLNINAFQEGIAFRLQNVSELPKLADKRAPLPVKGVEVSDILELAQVLRGTPPKTKKPDKMTLENHKIAGLCYEFNLEAGQELRQDFAVARAENELYTINKCTELATPDVFDARLAQKIIEDNDFWEFAPKLSGDWADYVRRGLVYDLETLRTLARKPLGIYKHGWDAMQLQVPRTVLAEAALDMLILSYADPATAKDVLLGTFADAPEPNVPCSREDGSYNMIAADGSPCGTAPEWCFPFHCINLVYRKTGDNKWLGELFPYLKEFMQFWLSPARNDAQGRPFYKCSWEAGQDNSARFGISDDPSGGGALTEHIWAVDLQASIAQACSLMAEWAGILGLPQAEKAEWLSHAQKHTLQTRQLWHNGWFHDFDTVKHNFTTVIDTMQFAPLLTGTATPEQVAALRSSLANPPKHGQIFHHLMWPSVVFCLIEACSEAGQLDLAAKHSWEALQAVYRWMDSRPLDVSPEQGGLPGNGREYWPQVVNPNANPPRGGGGAEVYGWGCLGALLLLRYIVGFRERLDSPGFELKPHLPPEMMQKGKVYKINSLRTYNSLVNVTYTVQNSEDLTAEVIDPTGSNPRVVLTIKNGWLV
jgi:hypothetical protein